MQIFINNDHVLEVLGVTNAVTGILVSDATVRVDNITNSAGTPLTGENWPLAVPAVAGSPGDYRVILSRDIAFIDKQVFFAKVSVDITDAYAEWTLPLQVRKRS